MSQQIRVRLSEIADIADDVKTLEMRAVDGAVLPRFTAGAHIDLLLPGGLIRSYSLCNSQAEPDRYVVAVRRQDNGKGGSLAVHKALRTGAEILIHPPRNNFPLVPDAEHSVLIAGGIGVTPIMSMILQLEALGRSWELHYSSTSRQRAAFLDSLAVFERAKPGRVHFHFDDEHKGAVLDIAACLRGAPAQAHFYCCGPTPMLAAFKAQTEKLPDSHIHIEHFSSDVVHTKDGTFEVEFRRLGKIVTIAEGQTILEAAIELGCDVPYSCQEGVCGSCEVTVLEGIPDHQDEVLSRQEREANTKMMICCSRSKSPKLVLDI